MLGCNFLRKEIAYAQNWTYRFGGYPHHVVQRGHNRQMVFAAEEDYQRYVRDLRELKDAFEIKVYAYCLMTNHVHFLLFWAGTTYRRRCWRREKRIGLFDLR